jgi:micrococcal nuclease
VTCHRFGFWNKTWLAVALALVLVLLAPGCGRVTENAVFVTRVIDGDTIETEGGYHVRYIGIDAPEKDEPYYWEAFQANRNLVEHGKVRLEKDVEDKDKYGRLLRYVWVNNTMVNAELVRLGYAYSHSYPPNLKYQTYLLQMEKEAQEHKRGLWGS